MQQTLTAASAADPVVLALHGVSLAGRDDTSMLPPGQARPIATGAAMPPNADAVVRVEEVRATSDAITVLAPVPSGHVTSASRARMPTHG
jgi:molybdopterin molybdotransferase